MTVNEKELEKLKDYYNAKMPFVDNKEIFICTNGISVVTVNCGARFEEGELMPEEEWETLDNWHRKYLSTNF